MDLFMGLLAWYLLSPWYKIGLLFVLFVFLENSLSIKQKIPWILAILILGPLVMPIYFYKNNSKEIVTEAPWIGKYFKWALFIFFFAPSPFFLCIDSCTGIVILPPIISWLPIATIYDFFVSFMWFWHIISCILFALVFIKGNNYIKKQQWTSGKKICYKVLLYISYWILIILLWRQVPLNLQKTWLGQP